MPGRPDRYARQIVFPGIGEAGQKRLSEATVALVGCGALGTVIATLLTRAGVGRLRIIDRDVVEWSNLQRQILFDEADAERGVPKAAAAAQKLGQANSDVAIQATVADFDAEHAERLLHEADLVMDGTDNFETRYVLNEACVKLGIPWVYAGAVASYGVVMPIVPGITPCLRCVFVQPVAPGTVDTCDTAGVLGPVIATIAGIASAEAIKLLVGANEQVRRGLLWIDLWHNSVQETKLVGPTPDCPVCQARRFDLLDQVAGSSTVRLCGRNAVQVRPRADVGVRLDELAERLRPLGPVDVSDYLVRVKINDFELAVFADARAIIKGTEDLSVARSLYARYVGL